MISITFLTANRLNRLLDALVEQDRGAGPAQIAGIDPDLAQTALAVQQLAGQPTPDAEFTESLLSEILSDHHRVALSPDREVATNDRGVGWQGRDASSLSWLRERSSPAAWFSFAATAALVAVTLATAWVIFGSGRSRWLIDQPSPALSIASPAPTTGEEIASIVWKSRGDPERPINNPGHLTVDPMGNLWVVDPGAGGFQILSPDGSFLYRWGEGGTEPGQFNLEAHGFPSGAVAFDEAGNLYVADAGNRRVQKFSPERTFIRSWGSEGTGDGQFLQPDNLTIDRQGRVYVLDGDRDDIQVFDADGSYLRTIGRYGVGEGQFLFFDNGGLSFDPEGNLWVADISNQRIQKFSSDGIFLAAFGKFGFGAGQFSSPNGIAVDDAHRLFVVDVGKTGTRVQAFSADGVYLGAWSEAGGQMADLSTATSIALDGVGNIYATDYLTDTILKLKLLPPLSPSG